MPYFYVIPKLRPVVFLRVVLGLLAIVCALLIAIYTTTSSTTSRTASPVAPGSKITKSTPFLLINGSVCSGTLLKKRVILTAGHCVIDQSIPTTPAVFFGVQGPLDPEQYEKTNTSTAMSQPVQANIACYITKIYAPASSLNKLDKNDWGLIKLGKCYYKARPKMKAPLPQPAQISVFPNSDKVPIIYKGFPSYNDKSAVPQVLLDDLQGPSIALRIFRPLQSNSFACTQDSFVGPGGSGGGTFLLNTQVLPSTAQTQDIVVALNVFKAAKAYSCFRKVDAQMLESISTFSNEN